MPAAAAQQTHPAAAPEVDPLQAIARLKVSVEVLRREALTPRSRDRARLIAKEVRALERELPADGSASVGARSERAAAAVA